MVLALKGIPRRGCYCLLHISAFYLKVVLFDHLSVGLFNFLAGPLVELY